MDATRTRVKVADLQMVYRKRYPSGRVPGVTVVPALGQPKPRTVTVLAGIGNSEPFGCHNATLAALEKAVVERIMVVNRPAAPEAEKVMSVGDVHEGFSLPPNPCETTWKATVGPYMTRLKRKLTKHKPVDVETFVSYYQGKRRTIYEQAGEVYQRGGLKRSHAYVGTFVKAEKTAKNGVPRAIQPRNPVYNVAVGRYLKPLEHEIYDAIDRVWGQSIVMKGRNADSTGQQLWENWNTLKKPRAIFLDVSRFDQHVHELALQSEHSVYKYMYDNDPELCKLLSWQLETLGFGRVPEGLVKYFVRGRRMSGDMNTAVGNIILMTSMLWGFFHKFRTKDGRKCYHTGGNNGDDHCLFVEDDVADEVIAALPEYFLKLGFTLVVEGTTSVFEEIEFCRSHPVKVGAHYRMVRGVVDTLSKDLVCFKPVVNEKAWNVKRRAIAQCGLALTDGVPVFTSFYRCLLRGAEAAKVDGDQDVTGMMNLSRGMVYHGSEIEDDTRVSFWKAYGIDPNHQLVLEAEWDAACCVWSEISVKPIEERYAPFVYI